MTIIDELLILLDEIGESAAIAIPPYLTDRKLQVVFSSLGRLVNRGWVAKRQRRGQEVYSLTIHGVNELNKTLDAIRQEPKDDWNKQWHLAIFDIPESKRGLRDGFRIFLRESGYGLLKSSVWISPRPREEEIRRYAKRHSLLDYLTLLNTAKIEDNYQSIVIAQQAWDWAAIERAYRHFLDMAERHYGKLRQGEAQSRFMAKKLVFLYAQAVTLDPQLPAAIAPNATVSRKAREYYVRIRPYCLKDI